jgi:hypothetical protein
MCAGDAAKQLPGTLLTVICCAQLSVTACSGTLLVDDGAAGTAQSGGSSGMSGGAGGIGGSDGTAGSGGLATAGTGGTAGEAGSAGSAGMAGGPPFDCEAQPTIAISGTVRDLQVGVWPLLEGVQVCLKDCSIPCAISNAEGQWMLSGIPAYSLIVLLFSKAGYASSAVARTTGAEDGQTLQVLPTEDVANLMAKAAGFEWPLQGKAIINVGTSSSSATMPVAVQLAGSTVSISWPPLKGPVYADEDWIPDPSLTETSEAGWAFFQVDPGEYTVTANHPGRVCTPDAFVGWPGPTHTMRVPAIPDYIMSQTWFVCPDP